MMREPEVSPSSSQTLDATYSPPPLAATLDLSTLPPIFVSATHYEIDDLHELEEKLAAANAMLTYDIHEARIVLSKVTKKARIQFDLRARGLWTEELVSPDSVVSQADFTPDGRSSHTAKKRKAEASLDKNLDPVVLDDSSTASEDDGTGRVRSSKYDRKTADRRKSARSVPVKTSSSELSNEAAATVRVVNVKWFEQSFVAGKGLALENYTTFLGRAIPKPQEAQALKLPRTTGPQALPSLRTTPNKAILERAKEDAPSPNNARADRFGKRRFADSVKSTAGASWEAGYSNKTNNQYAHLLHATTSEQDGGYSSDLPEMPDWVKQGVKYACQRVSPRQNPNDAFIALLKKIKLARLLTNDEIGVRAYSTSIASLAAYPSKLSSPREIVALPGCDAKIANLFIEWKNTGSGTIQAVADIDADPDLRVLRLFYEIWGVGATTAREFYYDRGWQDLDDIVEFGWSSLTRVQQIGVKFYDEFLDPIPRAEVESIGAIVHAHAVAVRDSRIQSMIVGGHRRGKEASGDVDIIVSHPDEARTANLVNDIVASLEDAGYITHTLLLSLNSTHRNQQTLPFRTSGSSSGAGGHNGFDTLDKALVVWQSPTWPTQAADLARDPGAKNPNIHRRVDIIVAPWRTVGCAVAGWTSGTTFQRDLRRYAKNVKGWKFDSSGVRRRGDGKVVDLEGWAGGEGGGGGGRGEGEGRGGGGGGEGKEGGRYKARARTMEEAERRVFEGLGLVWREPWERCTG